MGFTVVVLWIAWFLALRGGEKELCMHKFWGHLRLPNLTAWVCIVFFFSFVCILLSNILSAFYCTWTIYINVTILWEYSGNSCACASSRYQTIFLLPHGLGTNSRHQVLSNLPGLSRTVDKLLNLHTWCVSCLWQWQAMNSAICCYLGVMLKLLHNSQCVQTACYLKFLGKIFWA